MTEEPGKESKTTEQLSTHLEVACRHFPSFVLVSQIGPIPSRRRPKGWGNELATTALLLRILPAFSTFLGERGGFTFWEGSNKKRLPIDLPGPLCLGLDRQMLT